MAESSMRMNWASCKRQGASAYKEGSYAEALEYFQGAIGLLIDESESVIVSKMDEAQVSYSFMTSSSSSAPLLFFSCTIPNDNSNSCARADAIQHSGVQAAAERRGFGSGGCEALR